MVKRVMKASFDYDFSDSLSYDHVDTILNQFYYYHDNGFKNKTSLGNAGSAFGTLLFPSIKFGFSVDEGKFFDHNFNKDVGNDVYNTNVPFARVSYISGTKKYQDFDVFFTENIGRQINFSIAYNTFGSDGFYINQSTVGRRFDFQNNFKSKNNKYGFFIRFKVNSGTANENGGVKSDSLYNELIKLSPFDVENNKLKVQVWQENALNHYDDRKLSVSQFFKFGKSDTTGMKSGELFVVMNNNGFTSDYWYEDELIDSVYYSKFGLQVKDSSKVVDQYHTVGLRNKLFIKYNFKDNGIVIRGGGDVNLFQNTTLNAVNDIYEVSLFGSMDNLRLGDYIVSGYVEKAISGFNSDGYLVKGALFGELIENVLVGNFKIELMKTLPSYKKLHYSNSVIGWDNDFDYMLFENFELDFRIDRLGLEFNSSLGFVENYVYYGLNVAPEQFEESFYNYRFDLSKDFSLGFYHFDVGLIYQNVESMAPVNMSNWIGKLSIYYQKMLFKKALELRYGIDYWQNSLYNANSYAPFTRTFVLQEGTNVGNFPYLNFYVSARVKGAQGFVNFQNIGQFIFRENYMMVPDYPLQDYGMSFGIRWDFYN